MAMSCPRCSYDLSNSIHAEGATCPECGWRYSRRDLIVLQQPADRGGAPRSLAPHERRVPGWLFFLILFVLIVLGAIVANVFFGLDPRTAAAR